MRKPTALAALLIALPCPAFAASLVRPPDEPSIVGKVVPRISFEDEAGRLRDTSRFEGQPLIILPIYTQCHGSCSRLATHLKNAVLKSNQDLRKFQVFLFSFDPQDSLADLKSFRDQHGLPASWTIGRLKSEQITRLTSALDYRFAREGQEWIHPDVAAVLGPNLAVARILKGPAFTDRQIVDGLSVAQGVTSWRLRYGPYLFAFSAMLMIAASILLAVTYDVPRAK